jgi:hypothetical protein
MKKSGSLVQKKNNKGEENLYNGSEGQDSILQAIDMEMNKNLKKIT